MLRLNLAKRIALAVPVIVGILNAPALGAQDQAPSAGRLTGSSTPLRILVAEDNVVNQKVAGKLLEKRGHSVVIASDGRQAVAALEEECFDLVLMDIQMPEMDGREATAAIREREKRTGTHVPIVALTAHAMKDGLDKCLSYGMDDYLTKPIDVQQLDAILARLTLIGALGLAQGIGRAGPFEDSNPPVAFAEP